MSTELAEYEKLLKRDPSQAGEVLLHVRDHGIWRRFYPTFKMFCDHNGFSPAQVSQLITDAERNPAAGKEIATGDLTRDQAASLTRRIKTKAGTIRDDMQILVSLVEEAKAGNAHTVLGFKSWTAYVSDALAGLKLRLSPEKRQEWVSYLTGEGMSAAAIGPIVGASQSTVDRDRAAIEPTSNEGGSRPPVMGLDGKQRPPAQPRPEHVETVTGEVLDPVEPEPVHVHAYVCSSCGKRRS